MSIAGPGHMPRDAIKLVLDGGKNRFKACYERALLRNPELRGSVTVSFDIGVDGKVSHVGSTGGDMPDAEERACVLEAHRNLRFRKPEGGYVRVVRALRFEPSQTSPAHGAKPTR